MHRLNRERPSGLTIAGLRTWGLICLMIGVLGSCVIERKLLGVGTMSNQQLLEAMQNSSKVMAMASAAIVLQAIETCAAPIFCFLLVEGFLHTSNLKNYFLRILALAVLTEIPFNFANSGELFDLGSRNPVFGLVLCLAVLFFFSRYRENSFSNILIKIVVTVAAILWCGMLAVSEGACCLILTLVIWALRDSPLYRDFAGAVVAVVCSIFNPFYLAAPMGFLLIHFYNGEKGDGSRFVNYLAYPAILAFAGAAVYFL